MDTWIAEVVGKMHINRITQTDIAKKTDYTNDYVSMILLGKKNSPAAKEKICKAVDEIIEERKTTNENN